VVHEVCKRLGKMKRMKLAWNFKTGTASRSEETYNIPDTS
jgi:hypothetical protein